MSFFLGSWGMNQSAEQTNGPRTPLRFTPFVCPELRLIPHSPLEPLCSLYDLFVHALIHSPWTQKTRGPKGHCRSPENNEGIKKLTSEWNKKWQHFIPHASRSLLYIWFVAVAFQSEEALSWRSPPPPPPRSPILALPWIRPWVDLAKTP